MNISNSTFENFGLLYSTIKVAIFNSEFSSNTFITYGTSSFIICEKELYLNNVYAYYNNGRNFTLIQTFNTFTALNSNYCSNVLKVHFDFYSDI